MRTVCWEPGDVVGISASPTLACSTSPRPWAGSGGPRPARHAHDGGERLRAQSGREWARRCASWRTTRACGACTCKTITRHMVEIPILPETEVLRGDILTIGGQTRSRGRRPSRPWATPTGRSRAPILAVVAAGVLRGGPRRCHQLQVEGGLPISLSTSDGRSWPACCGYFRTVQPTFGNIPGTGALADEYARLERLHRHCRHQCGAWIHLGPAARGPQPVSSGAWSPRRFRSSRSVPRPLRLPLPSRHSLWRVRRRTDDDGGARHDSGSGPKARCPRSGYGMPYAIGNTLLTIFGMVMVLWMVGGSR